MTKQDVVNRIKDYEVPSYIKNIDIRLDNYINDVLSHPNQSNKYEILSVIRFIEFCSKYTLNGREIKKFFKFYECLKFPSNKRYAVIQINTNSVLYVCKYIWFL